jgi:hypothetical protein
VLRIKCLEFPSPLIGAKSRFANAVLAGNFEKRHTKGVDIGCRIAMRITGSFGCQKGEAAGTTTGKLLRHRQSEAGDIKHLRVVSPPIVVDDIFWHDVSVDHVVLVDKSQTSKGLANEAGDPTFGSRWIFEASMRLM